MALPLPEKIYPRVIPHTMIETMGLPGVKIYPYSSFRYCSKRPNFEKDKSIPERLKHRIENYNRDGMRTTVEGILLVHQHGDTYILLLKIGKFHKLPGGRLKPGENEIEGLKRKLTSKLGCILPQNVPDWQIGECVATWWRPGFLGKVSLDTIPGPKECIKLFIVHLSEGMHIAEPSNFNLVFVPLLTVRRQGESYGTVISSIPKQLSKLKLNIINHEAGVQN